MFDYCLSAMADSAILQPALEPDGRHAKPPQVCAASREGPTGAM